MNVIIINHCINLPLLDTSVRQRLSLDKSRHLSKAPLQRNWLVMLQKYKIKNWFFNTIFALDKLYLLVAIDFILFPITPKELCIYFAVLIVTFIILSEFSILNSLPCSKSLRGHYHFQSSFIPPSFFPKWLTYPVLARLSSTRPWKSEIIKFSFYQYN